MPFSLRNIKEDLEDIGSRFDGAPDLEFRSATEALALEGSGACAGGPRRDLGASEDTISAIDAMIPYKHAV